MRSIRASSATEPPKQEPDNEQKQLLKRVKRVLRERVDEVRVGGRLRESAACLVLKEHDLGYQMRELLRPRATSRRPRSRVSS